MSTIAVTPTQQTRLTVGLPQAVALGTAAIAAAVAAALLASPWILVAWLVPDVAMVLGVSEGRLAPRAVPAYNALHALPGPLVLIAAGVLVPALLAPGLIWLSHVLLDRALGFGLRTPDGWQRA